ncbi:MAG TPA: hypothetical protein VH083_09435, partial [Myxococcales bacterium]|nr:hypothetical protein [Myxococcales bacterium]
MRPGLPELLPLICPLCRRHSERGLELSSLQLLDGLLRCQGCGHEYAVAEGIPVLLREPAALPQLDTAEAVDLAVKGPDDAPVPHAMAQLSSYLGAY